MPLDDISFNKRSVTAFQRPRHAILSLYFIELPVVNTVGLNIKSICLQVAHPLGAAPSGWAFVNSNGRAGHSGLREERRRHVQRQSGSTTHPCLPKSLDSHSHLHPVGTCTFPLSNRVAKSSIKAIVVKESKEVVDPFPLSGKKVFEIPNSWNISSGSPVNIIINK